MREAFAHAFGAPRSAVESLSRGHRGGVISMHRALTHFRLGPMNVVTSLSLFFLFSWIWVVVLPSLCHFWNHFLALSLQFLPLNGKLEVAVHQFNSSYRLEVPYLRIYSVLPNLWTWSVTCGITLLMFGATFKLPREWVPFIYMARGILLVQATALFYFALWPERFPHSPDSYMEALITSGI